MIPSHFKCRFFPSGDATGHGAGLGMTTLRPAQMQLVVVPSERSDRGASPKGVRDLGVDSGLSQERDPSPPGTRSAMEPPSG